MNAKRENFDGNWERTNTWHESPAATNSLNLYYSFSFPFYFADGVRAKVYFRAQPHTVGSHVYLSVEEIKMDFSVQEINMGIRNLHNGNAVLGKFSQAEGEPKK